MLRRLLWLLKWRACDEARRHDLRRRKRRLGRPVGRDLRSRAAPGSDPALRALAACKAPGWHAQDQGSRRDMAHRQEAVQAEGLGQCTSWLGTRAAVPW